MEIYGVHGSVHIHGYYRSYNSVIFTAKINKYILMLLVSIVFESMLSDLIRVTGFNEPKIWPDIPTFISRRKISTNCDGLANNRWILPFEPICFSSRCFIIQNKIPAVTTLQYKCHNWKLHHISMRSVYASAFCVCVCHRDVFLMSHFLEMEWMCMLLL